MESSPNVVTENPSGAVVADYCCGERADWCFKESMSLEKRKRRFQRQWSVFRSVQGLWLVAASLLPTLRGLSPWNIASVRAVYKSVTTLFVKEGFVSCLLPHASMLLSKAAPNCCKHHQVATKVNMQEKHSRGPVSHEYMFTAASAYRSAKTSWVVRTYEVSLHASGGFIATKQSDAISKH